MYEALKLLSPRRPELLIRPHGADGQYVVKDPRTASFFHLGTEEHFLLMQLDGQKDAQAICAAFERQFGEPLSETDLEEFLELARTNGFLAESDAVDRPEHREGCDETITTKPLRSKTQSVPRTKQSLLYWRKSLCDPDRLFTWLAPKISFFWTRTFLVLSAGCILLAAFLLWANRHELASSFTHALGWETAVLVCLAVFVVTMLHESAHGLTCKHFGGEVHEIGFLLLFLMPCFYCNVSDAWLFREKSKRLWVTFAGGYLELFLWALAVFVWRVTMPDMLVNHLAFVVLSVCGVQTLFNLNPLLKLDGYYLLSDWAEIPNLQQRAWGYITGQLRRILWGAPQPDHGPRARFLLGYGIASYLYSLVFLVVALVAMVRILGTRWGAVGIAAALLLSVLSLRSLLHGLSAGEVRKMILTRHKRTAVWCACLAAVPTLLSVVEMNDRASGSFQLRPASRAELRAPVAGFLQAVYFDEGDRVSPGEPVARLQVPDLESRLAQKRAEVREAQAKLRLLEAGPRAEELAEQRHRVERATAWRDLAREDLTHARQALEEELARLDKQIAQHRAELDAAHESHRRSESLRSRNALSDADLREAERKLQVTEAQLAQAEFEKRRRVALGTREAIAGLDAEAELAHREKDLADAQGTLTLMQAGSRPEEIDAERARLARLEEEANYLAGLEPKLAVFSPVHGVVTSAHIKEKVGQYLHEGDLICVVEEPTVLEAEIPLAEQAVARVRPGQPVELKARALPFDNFAARVDRIAPSAQPGEVQSRVIVYCRLECSTAVLRPGMSGYARIYTARRPIGEVLIDRAMRFLRTEFWW